MRRTKPVRKLLILGSLLFLTASCSPKPQAEDAASSLPSDSEVSKVVVDTTPSHVEASTLDPSKAKDLATEDFKQDKCNLYSVYGYTSYIPGVQSTTKTENRASSIQTDKVDVYHVIYIDGTSDTGGAYNDQGKAFAKAYNEVALKNCGA
jgi:hypothetical protein